MNGTTRRILVAFTAVLLLTPLATLHAAEYGQPSEHGVVSQADTQGALQGTRDTSPRKTAPAHKQTPVDFNHPPRDYVANQLHGWTVLVEKQLVEEAPDLAKSSLARLDKKLGETVAVLPAAALPDLRLLKLFLMVGPQANAGGRPNGLEYFRASAPKHHGWLDPRMGRSIVIFNAANYAKLSEFWALKSLVHEFGHAQHLEHWPEDLADTYDAWDHAVKARLYQIVCEEDKGTHNPNYAAQNHLEYFAELTATYFVGANYFPKDRAGLKAYDPAGYAMVEKLWGIRGAIPGATPGKPKKSSPRPPPKNRSRSLGGAQGGGPSEAAGAFVSMEPCRRLECRWISYLRTLISD